MSQNPRLGRNWWAIAKRQHTNWVKLHMMVSHRVSHPPNVATIPDLLGAPIHGKGTPPLIANAIVSIAVHS